MIQVIKPLETIILTMYYLFRPFCCAARVWKSTTSKLSFFCLRHDLFLWLFSNHLKFKTGRVITYLLGFFGSRYALLFTESVLQKGKLLLSWAPLEQETVFQGSATGNPHGRRHSSGSGEDPWHSLSWQTFPIYFGEKHMEAFHLYIFHSISW